MTLISLCQPCPKKEKCSKLCREAEKYVDQGQHRWRRGTERKLIFMNINNFPDADWVDGFGHETIYVQAILKKLQPRNREVFNDILNRVPKDKIQKRLGISRWVLNCGIRNIRKVVKRELR